MCGWYHIAQAVQYRVFCGTEQFDRVGNSKYYRSHLRVRVGITCCRVLDGRVLVLFLFLCYE